MKFDPDNRFWTTGQAPMRELPDASSRKMLDIPFGRVVRVTGHSHGDWIEAVYITAQKRYVGWVYQGYLEELFDEFPQNVVSIQSPTLDPHDAAQYIIFRGNTQYNLCGEICVCYITGDDLDTMLKNWEAKAVNIFRRVFDEGLSKGTGLDDLDSMLALYGYDVPVLRLGTALRDALLQRPMVTPGQFETLLEGNRIIVSVKISKTTGNLQASGILHWVVLEEVIPQGIDRGLVKLYNPFTNQHQMYSWTELKASMGAPSGLVVKR